MRNASLEVAGGTIMLSDTVFGTLRLMENCSLAIRLPSLEEAGEVFGKLSEGRFERMAFAPTFLSKRFGTLTDRFGIHSMISTDEGPSGAS